MGRVALFRDGSPFLIFDYDNDRITIFDKKGRPVEIGTGDLIDILTSSADALNIDGEDY